MKESQEKKDNMGSVMWVLPARGCSSPLKLSPEAKFTNKKKQNKQKKQSAAYVYACLLLLRILDLQ